MALGVGADDHGRDIVNGRRDSDLPEDRARLDQDAVLAVQSVSKHHRRAAGEVVQAVLVRYVEVIQTHDPDRVCNKRFCSGFLDGVNHLADHDRRNDAERSMRSPMGLDRDPFVLLEPFGEVHLFEQGLKLSRDAVAVVPSEGACGREIDVGHGWPHKCCDALH